MTRTLMVVPLAAICALSAPTARAQNREAPPPATGEVGSEAQQYYDRGRALYQEGRYNEAVVELQQALALDSSATILFYNIGLVYEKLGQFDRALEYLQRYLQTELSAEERERVESTIRRIDGARTHHSEQPAETRVVQVRVPVTFGSTPPPSFGRADALFFVAAGTSAAALAVMVVTGALAYSAQDEVDRFVVGESGSLDDRQAIVDRANDMALYSDVALVAAGLFAVTATLLYALRRGDPERESRSARGLPAFAVGVGPAGVGARIGGQF